MSRLFSMTEDGSQNHPNNKAHASEYLQDTFLFVRPMIFSLLTLFFSETD